MSNSEIAIVAEGLGKQYRIGARQDSFPTLRDSIARCVKWPVQRALAAVRRDSISAKPTTIWALQDVSLEVKRGEVLGIIGRNGSGKSTLLRILSRITHPSCGWADVHGRVGSMLEVGTGFHPELTGRENLYLNGSILGMKRAEIRRKFDAIVDFSGVEAFLDTPVKHYSSGMYVRLAFAVASHLEPEILMVDEVLAVGDADFQRKCLAKMEDVSKEGRTVLFVSHNMGLVQSLCQRALFMRNGFVQADNTAAKVVATYLQNLEDEATTSLLERTERHGAGQSRITRVEILGAEGTAVGTLVTGGAARFVFHVTRVLPRMSCCFTIYDQCGQPIAHFDSALHSAEDSSSAFPTSAYSCEIAEWTLLPGRYRLNVAILVDGETQDHVEGAGFFQVEQGTLRGRPVPHGAGYGSVFLDHRWTTPA